MATTLQRRATAPGEDHNWGPYTEIVSAGAGSAGPPRPARITTIWPTWARCRSWTSSAGPPRPARITTGGTRTHTAAARSPQRRATAPGEDHNPFQRHIVRWALGSAGPPRPATAPGEDHNDSGHAAPRPPAACAAPGHRARRGSQQPRVPGLVGPRARRSARPPRPARITTVVATQRTTIAAVCSAGPPRPARITTTTPTAWRRSCGTSSAGPPRPARITTPRALCGGAGALAAPGHRARRGSQPRLDRGRQDGPQQRRATAPGEDHNNRLASSSSPLVVGSAGPPRPARITTAQRSAGRWSASQQRRATAPGEDHNLVRLRVIRHRRGGAAPGHRARRGSQQRRQLIPQIRVGRSAGPPRPARITTSSPWRHRPPRRPCSAGPPRPARITTTASRPRPRPRCGRQRRATTPGEDHNKISTTKNGTAVEAAPGGAVRGGAGR